MFRVVIFVAVVFSVVMMGLAQRSDEPLPPCEWCGSNEAPHELSSQMNIAADDEPGARLILRGVLVHPNGTPAGGAIMYAYHTDNTGVYRKEGNETGNGRRHGVLRGWLRTADDGSFEIHTIKPAPYPTRTDPAHIHITVTLLGEDEIPVHSIWFEGDPRLTSELIEAITLPRDAWPIVSPEQDEDGTLIAECRIVAISTMR